MGQSCLNIIVLIVIFISELGLHCSWIFFALISPLHDVGLLYRIEHIGGHYQVALKMMPKVLDVVPRKRFTFIYYL